MQSRSSGKAGKVFLVLFLTPFCLALFAVVFGGVGFGLLMLFVLVNMLFVSRTISVAPHETAGVEADVQEVTRRQTRSLRERQKAS